jgi:hypothetical protein
VLSLSLSLSLSIYIYIYIYYLTKSFAGKWVELEIMCFYVSSSEECLNFIIVTPSQVNYDNNFYKSENKGVEQVLPGSEWGEEGKVAQTVYAHVSKCKNDKIKRTILKS